MHNCPNCEAPCDCSQGDKLVDDCGHDCPPIETRKPEALLETVHGDLRLHETTDPFHNDPDEPLIELGGQGPLPHRMTKTQAIDLADALLDWAINDEMDVDEDLI